MRRLMQIIGVLAGVLVIGALLLEEGEIVALETWDDERSYVTQLWIVELDGARYLRSGRPDTLWLARVRANPDVGLRAMATGHGDFELLLAVPVSDRALRDRVNRAMAEKYGFSDSIWSWMVDRSKAVVIELRPHAEASAGSVP